MRTKEKFYENLNNKHVSIEKRAERFEFKDIKTLDALLSGGESLLNNHKSAMTKWKKSDDEYNAWGKQERLSEKRYDELVKEEKDLVKKHDKEKKIASDNKIQQFKSYQKVADNFEKATIKNQGDEEQVIIIQNKIKGIADKIAINLQMFKDGAKALGIDVSGKIGKYKSMIKKLVEKENIL